MYWNETKRRPMPLQGINATSDNTWVADTLDKGLDNIQQRLYTLFAKYDNYSTWSNEAWIPDGSNSSLDSIESLHDTIHLACGGNFGHMAIIAYSSFDPLFFLHHTNVDRLFAMWQIVNNESWLEPMSAILPTRTINTGDNQTSRTDLTPFYFNSTHFWNSDQVRDHKIFGYSYAEVVDGNRADTIAAINRLYRPASMNISMPNHVDISQKRSSMGLVVHDSSYREWTVNVDVNKFALGASFNIHIFLGKIPEYSAKWELADSNIGTLGVFAGGHAHADMGPLRIGGTIPLTRALIDLVAAGELPSLDPRHVKPFIQHNLGYAVMHNNGSSVESDRVDGLHINVVSSLVRLPGSESELVAWGEADIYFELY